MPEFHDNAGRKWIIEVNAATVSVVREYYRWFARGPASFTFQQLAAKVETLVNVLYLLCRDQADAAGVSDVQFGRALGSDVLGNPIEHATEAFITAYLAFIQPSERDLLLAAKAQNDQAFERAKQRVLARQTCDPQTLQQIAEAL